MGFFFNNNNSVEKLYGQKGNNLEKVTACSVQNMTYIFVTGDILPSVKNKYDKLKPVFTADVR